MKNIKKGIKNDFDSIEHRSKEEMLGFAGIRPSAPRKRRRLCADRLISVALAAAMLLSFGAILTLAENNNALIDEIFVKIENMFPDKDAEKSPAPIDRRMKPSNEFNVLLLDYANDSKYYYRSVKDAVADYGENLYYPAYEGYENAFQAHIIYSMRGDNPSFQIEYARETLEICWIKIGVTVANGGMNPFVEKYESHGAEFYISEYIKEGPNNYSGHLVEGVLEGNSYQFFVKTVEEGKLIVDSLAKAE